MLYYKINKEVKGSGKIIINFVEFFDAIMLSFLWYIINGGCV